MVSFMKRLYAWFFCCMIIGAACGQPQPRTFLAPETLAGLEVSHPLRRLVIPSQQEIRRCRVWAEPGALSSEAVLAQQAIASQWLPEDFERRLIALKAWRGRDTIIANWDKQGKLFRVQIDPSAVLIGWIEMARDQQAVEFSAVTATAELADVLGPSMLPGSGQLAPDALPHLATSGSWPILENQPPARGAIVTVMWAASTGEIGVALLRNYPSDPPLTRWFDRINLGR